MQPDSLIKNSLIGLAALLLLGVGALLPYSFDPSAPNNYFPRCPSYWLLGVYCPGCGITRALHALLHGDVVQAFAYNPLAILSAPVLVWMAFKPRWIYHPLAPKIAFAILLSYGVLRNLPYEPFVYLAPHTL